MKRQGSLLSWALFALMLLAAACAWALKPTQLLADALPAFKLADVVPTSFADWQEMKAPSAQIVDPTQQALVQAIYTQTLARTYVNSKGYAIMLSIAYGRDQRDSLALHQPELCYPAQGFRVLDKRASTLEMQHRYVDGTQLETQSGLRREPVTYWTLIGDRVYRGSIRKRLFEMQYGFKNQIADGMLVRISSIDRDTAHAFKEQAKFAAEFVTALPDGMVNRIAGKGKS